MIILPSERLQLLPRRPSSRRRRRRLSRLLLVAPAKSNRESESAIYLSFLPLMIWLYVLFPAFYSSHFSHFPAAPEPRLAPLRPSTSQQREMLSLSTCEKHPFPILSPLFSHFRPNNSISIHHNSISIKHVISRSLSSSVILFCHLRKQDKFIDLFLDTCLRECGIVNYRGHPYNGTGAVPKRSSVVANPSHVEST